jgi:tubulin monoglycylase TTLL3/8
MIDDNFKVFLIEINTNPDITICCPILSKIIPNMLENSFKIAIDPIFPPPYSNHSRRCNFITNAIENNKYQLIYDSNQDFA